MQLSLPNKDELIEKLQIEYESLMVKMNDYYQAQKDWLESTKDQLMEKAERSKLNQRYDEFKFNLSRQQEVWAQFDPSIRVATSVGIKYRSKKNSAKIPPWEDHTVLPYGSSFPTPP